MKRLVLASLALTVLSGCFARSAAPVGTINRPNILFVLADDMGWGDLRCHGNKHLDTPALDQLRSQGVALERFLVGPVCAPTRASLLTGRHHLRLRVINTTNALEVMHGDELTLAEALKAEGYATGCFGKWHNGSNHPSDARGQGFDEFFGFSGGFFSNYFDPELEHNGVVAPRKGFITDVLTDAALAFIERERARPFFCYVPFNAPHSPVQAPADLFAKYSGLGFAPMEAAAYAMVENIDHNVGRLLGKLDELGLAGNTIVIFSSDNGPNSRRFNGGMRGIKGHVFEGGLRVPFFIRWPGRLEAGRAIEQIVQHVDVFPTLLELTGVRLPKTKPLDGISIAPVLQGSVERLPDRTIFEITGRGGRDGTPIARFPGTARTQTHSWVHDGKTEYLFDMQQDPGETTNLLAQQPALAAALRNAYDEWLREASAATDGRIQRFPIILTEGTNLLVSSATREGGARFFGQGWDYDWATGFDSSDAAVVWTLEVPHAATYEVSVLHTAKTAGGSIGVSVAGKSIRKTIAAAYDPPEIPRPDLVKRWEVPDKVFQPLGIGSVEVPAGRHALRVKAAPGVEIQSVRLKREPDSR